MSAEIEVTIGDATVTVPVGTPVGDVLSSNGFRREGTIAALMNHQLSGLDAPMTVDSTVVPVSMESRAGLGVLRRSVSHIFHAVFRELYPDLLFAVGQSMQGGYFYEVYDRHKAVNDYKLTPPAMDLGQMAKRLSARLAEVAQADLQFTSSLVPIGAVGHLLEDPFGTRQRLLKAVATPMIQLQTLLGYTDLAHGPYAPSTRYGRGAEVVAYPPGLVLRFPGAPDDFSPDAKRQLWRAYAEARDWNRALRIGSVGALNAAILDDRIGDVIRVAEAQHEKKLAAIADAITKTAQTRRIVAVAGPSSSGKTTYVKRLAIQLQVNGIRPVIIGLDDYYRPREQYPRDANGEFDFEHIEALNLPQFRAHMKALLAGETVHVPRFDFAAGRPKPESEWRPLCLADDQILIIEGIHALNPDMLEGVPRENQFLVFISALTQLAIDETNRIFTSDSRLLRRLVRDRRYRGTPACDTLARWPSVRRGEGRNIFPFQERADVMFNSTLIYEVAVLRTFAWRYLLEVPHDHPQRAEAYRLLQFLEMFVPLLPDEVPANSLLREFMGGSAF